MKLTRDMLLQKRAVVDRLDRPRQPIGDILFFLKTELLKIGQPQTSDTWFISESMNFNQQVLKMALKSLYKVFIQEMLGINIICKFLSKKVFKTVFKILTFPF